MSFDATSRGGVGGGVSLGRPVARASTSAKDAAEAARSLRDALGPGPFAALFLFVSDDRDRPALAQALNGAFGDAPILGVTTPGEIGPEGVASGSIVALALPRETFRVSWRLVEGADRFRRADGEALARTMLGELTARGGTASFGLMMSDASAGREEALAFAFGGAETHLPFVGGSFGAPGGGGAFVLADGRFEPRAAAAVYVAGPLETTLLRSDHLAPTDRRMVITACDRDHRRVTELNGEAAAQEYARLCGLDPRSLDAAALADHPLLAAEGGGLHGRTLRTVDADGALVFSAAVEEGMILRLALPQDPADDLEAGLASLAPAAAPEALIAFDDATRRRAAQSMQSTARIGAAFARAGAVGGQSIGQQVGRMHCAGSFVGLALHRAVARPAS
ncbi:MAG: FIST N-terminal domain-containing protein [Pseudomonadota bacterium]